MTVYATIKKLACDKNITIRHIERGLDLSNGSISKWDKSIPRADNLQKVADYLGATTTYILNKSKEGK